jgi:hypothetical protein
MNMLMFHIPGNYSQFPETGIAACLIKKLHPGNCHGIPVK